MEQPFRRAVTARLRSTAWLAPWLLLASVACSAPGEPNADSIEAKDESKTVQSVLGQTVTALAAGPQAFELVERHGSAEVRRGELRLRYADSGRSRFVLTWQSAPPRTVSSDGTKIFASRPDGSVVSSGLDRAGTVLRAQEAGKLAPTVLDPSKFGQYGGEVVGEAEGLIRLRAPIPGGGAWELVVSAVDHLPREVSFQAGPEVEPEMLVVTPVAADVPEALAAYRLEPQGGEGMIEFFAGPAPGDEAPAVAFELADGTRIELGDLRGSAVVLDFWATWCVPCRPGMQELEELHQEFASDGLRVYGLRLWDQGDPTAFLESIGITYPTGDGAPLAEPFAISAYGLPSLYVIDRQGRIADLVVGFNPELTPPKVRSAVLEALDS